MRFDDFDIDAVAEYGRGGLQQLETEVDADAHVGCIHQRDVSPGGRHRRFELPVATGGADYQLLAVTATEFDMPGGGGRMSEVDQGIERIGIETVAQDHAIGCEPGENTCVAAEGWTIVALQRLSQLHGIGFGRRLDQVSPHAPGGSGYGKTNHDFMSSKNFFMLSIHEVSFGLCFLPA